MQEPSFGLYCLAFMVVFGLVAIISQIAIRSTVQTWQAFADTHGLQFGHNRNPFFFMMPHPRLEGEWKSVDVRAQLGTMVSGDSRDDYTGCQVRMPEETPSELVFHGQPDCSDLAEDTSRDWSIKHELRSDEHVVDTGDAAFDDAFKAGGPQLEAARQFLAQEEVRETLLELFREEETCERVTISDGWLGIKHSGWTEDPERMEAGLDAVAEAGQSLHNAVSSRGADNSTGGEQDGS